MEEEDEEEKKQELNMKTEPEERRAEDGNMREVERRCLVREGVKEDTETGVEGAEKAEHIQHRLEETSASLAAALQVVEHKIKEEDKPNE